MRGYEFDKLICQIGHDQEDWTRFVQHADQVLARCGASDEEKVAFLGGDLQALHRSGVNGYLLLRYARWHSKDNVRVVQELQAG